MIPMRNRPDKGVLRVRARLPSRSAVSSSSVAMGSSRSPKAVSMTGVFPAPRSNSVPPSRPSSSAT